MQFLDSILDIYGLRVEVLVAIASARFVIADLQLDNVADLVALDYVFGDGTAVLGHFTIEREKPFQLVEIPAAILCRRVSPPAAAIFLLIGWP